MHTKTNALRFLVAQVRRGDVRAADELSRTMEPQLASMVRSILRRGRTDSTLAERVFAEDRELSNDGVIADEHWRCGWIARRICRSFVEGLLAECSGCLNAGSTVRG